MSSAPKPQKAVQRPKRKYAIWTNHAAGFCQQIFTLKLHQNQFYNVDPSQVPSSPSSWLPKLVESQMLMANCCCCFIFKLLAKTFASNLFNNFAKRSSHVGSLSFKLETKFYEGAVYLLKVQLWCLGILSHEICCWNLSRRPKGSFILVAGRCKLVVNCSNTDIGNFLSLGRIATV